MTRLFLRILLAASLTLAFACGDDGPVTPTDSGVDSGSEEMDAGEEMDAAAEMDAGEEMDAAVETDAGEGMDAAAD